MLIVIFTMQEGIHKTFTAGRLSLSHTHTHTKLYIAENSIGQELTWTLEPLVSTSCVAMSVRVCSSCRVRGEEGGREASRKETSTLVIIVISF